MQRLFRQGKSLGLVAMALVLATALLLGSVAPSQAAQSERAVKLGLLAVFTGPIATMGSGMCMGMIDYMEYVNKHGGIGGETKVDLLWSETGRAPIPDAITAYKRFKDAGVVAIMTPLGMQMSLLAPRLQRDEIVMFAEDPHILPDLTITKPEQWIFGIDCGFSCMFATAVKWFNQNWTESRPMRLGLIVYDNPESRSLFEDGIALPAIKQMGIDYVGHEVMPLMGAVDTTVEWLRLAGKKADMIFVCAWGGTMTTLIKDAARLEIQGKGIKLCGAMGSIDIYQFPIVRGAMNGWYGIIPLAHDVLAVSPGAKAMLEMSAKRGWKEAGELSINYTGGWLTSMLLCEGIKLAIEKVGYENLTGRAVREGIISIKDFDCGLGLPPITISNSMPYWSRGEYMEQVRELRFVTISDWIENVYNLEFPL